MTITTHDFDAFVQFAMPLIERSGDELSWGQLIEHWKNQDQRTPLVELLDHTRSEFVAEGGKLLSDEEVYAEADARRGGCDMDSA